MPTDTTQIVNKAWNNVHGLRPELNRLRPELPPDLYSELAKLGWQET